ncbi:MAG: carboxymuconolactone decarboxylase family protein [Deltaproteobacteria bacterium]|nr:carboxymuconolactone decarboxylase family protein [Deltaproteobacteria bacterium]
MPRLKQVGTDEGSALTNKLLKRVGESMGIVPNMFKCMGSSEMALDGFMAMNGSLGAGSLGGKYMKMVVLATSELNNCIYCASAHTQLAKNAKLLTDEECANARRCIGTDDKSQAMLDFVKKVHKSKGRVADKDIQAVRKAGFGDAEIVEMLGTMSLITFANYISNVAEPDLDFPEAPKVS